MRSSNILKPCWIHLTLRTAVVGSPRLPLAMLPLLLVPPRMRPMRNPAVSCSPTNWCAMARNLSGQAMHAMAFDMLASGYKHYAKIDPDAALTIFETLVYAGYRYVRRAEILFRAGRGCAFA